MALNIKNEEVVALVRELATRRGTDMTEAIRQAVQHELDVENTVDEAAFQRRMKAIKRIQMEMRKAPILDPRPSNVIRDEINEEIFE